RPGGVNRRIRTYPVGNAAWSDSSRHLYIADSEGNLDRYDPVTQQGEQLAFHGDNPVPMPLKSPQLIFRRSRAPPRVAQPAGFEERDPMEIVLGDLETLQTRVLIPESRDVWTPLAVSPDGKWLVLSSNRDVDKKKLGQVRLYLLSLKHDQPAEPRPIGPTCA